MKRDNKALGIGSIVLDFDLEDVESDDQVDAKFDVNVNITVLPVDVLADEDVLMTRIKHVADKPTNIYQIASDIFAIIKEEYSGKGYSCKAEVVVDDKGGMRVHKAG